MYPRRRRPIFLLLSSLSFVVLASCRSEPEPAPPPQPKAGTRSAPAIVVSPADAWFGYADQTGSRLLMLPGDTQPTDEQAKAVRTAVCDEGREFILRYVGFQRAATSTGRQNGANLENDAGHVFVVERAAIRPGGTCLLLPAGYAQRYPLVRNDYPKAERRQRLEMSRRINDPGPDVAPFEESGDVVRATIARIEREKNRKVRRYWVLHSAGPAQRIAIVEFEPEGDGLLASIVMATSQQLSFLDMPADRKDATTRGGCWRVDDGCRLNPEEMDVPAVLGTAGETLVFYTSAGPEGQLARLLQVRGGTIVEVKSAYRYQAPV